MKLKKYQHKDLNRKKGLYFTLGLLIILVVIYIVLEWKTEDDTKGYDVGGFTNKELIKKDSTVVLETHATQEKATNQ